MRSYSKKMYNTGNHSVEEINYDARKKRSAGKECKWDIGPRSIQGEFIYGYWMEIK